MKKVVLAIVAPVLVLAAACGGDKKPAAAPAPEPTAEPTPVTSAPAEKEKMAVNVDDAILKACNLKFANVEEAPKFDFDSEQLTESEKAVLEQVAKCLTTGPLKGRAVDLVGRADPRGETEYNMTLGNRRADNVKAAIVQAGLAASQIATSSRGEMDATGTDEASWEKDRRVDVMLGS